MALDPLLPLITRDQILHEELTTLLEKDDYNLATMVNSKFCIIYFDNYPFLHLIGSCNFIQNRDEPLFYHLYVCLSYQSFHMGYYASTCNLHPV